MEKYLTFLSLVVGVVLLLQTSLSSATVSLSSNAKFPTLEAEKLIRELNLFPKELNVVDRNETAPRKIVEKPLKFPNFDDGKGISAEELGHFAGYYHIQHSKAAK